MFPSNSLSPSLWEALNEPCTPGSEKRTHKGSGSADRVVSTRPAPTVFGFHIVFTSPLIIESETGFFVSF